jgi:hypothetical protein
MHKPITPPSIQIPPTVEGLVELNANRPLLNKHLRIKQLLLVTQTTLGIRSILEISKTLHQPQANL